MYNRRRSAEIAQRTQARRQREDDARRLRDEFPDLEGLSLSIKSYRSGGDIADSDHVKRIVVDSAPALFFVSCSDRSCQDGGHDVTSDVMRALRAHQTQFEGEHSCNGHARLAPCTRVVRYVGTAVWNPALATTGPSPR